MSIPMCSCCGAPCTPEAADESALICDVVEAAREWQQWRYGPGGIQVRDYEAWLAKYLDALEAAEGWRR
jgi:hypothetical protein